MKIISTGNTYEIFDDSLCTYENLPSQSYVVRFSKFKGFFLEKLSDIKTGEEKIYGVHPSKVEKVLKSFNSFNRNLGVILSGDKGIGKSLFARLLAEKGNALGYPLIIVDTYIPGIASYLSSIEQKVIVLFDEFDKTFNSNDNVGDNGDPQTEMLSLFDGVTGGQKLFVITCNNIDKLSDYLVNRPGRFHYHFRFNYPTPEEITEYLTDKLDEEYHDQIKPVIAFSRRIDLNYDCLRAIAFEINSGISFKEAISDLNIVNYGDNTLHTITIEFNNGMTASCSGISLGGSWVRAWLGKDGYDYIRVDFQSSDVCYDASNDNLIVPPEKLHLMWDENDHYKHLTDPAKAAGVKHVYITKSKRCDIHYAF